MKSLKGIILAIISSGTFGLIPLFSIPLMRVYQMSDSNILLYRFLFSSVMMGFLCLFRRRSFRVAPKDIMPLLGLGILYGFSAFFLLHSYHYIPSGLATTIHFLYPICVSFLMVVFFKERKSNVLLLSAILSLVGVALMCWNSEGEVHFIGVIFASITIVTYGGYIVALNQLRTKYLSADVLTFYILSMGALVMLVYGLVSGNVSFVPSIGAGVNLFMLALLSTVISGLALVMAIKSVGSTVTAVLGSMEPVVAVLVGVLVFHELFGVYSFIGIVLIILAVILVVLADRRKRK